MAENRKLPRSGGKQVTSVAQITEPASTTIKSLTEKLVHLADSYMKGSEKRSKVEKSLFYLKSQRLRNPASASAFLHHGGVHSLLQLSRNLNHEKEDERKLLALLWGTIANLCALDKCTQAKTIEDGITDLCQLLSKCSHSDVLNTVSRTIGNLASNDSFIPACKGNEVVIIQEFTRLLCTFEDSGCLQSILRALRILTQNGELNEELKLSQSIPAIANCLRLTDEAVTSSALRTLESVTCGCTPELISSLWATGNTPLQFIAQCIQGNNNAVIQEKATHILCECVKHTDGKASLSRAGGIEVLVAFLSSRSIKSSMIYSEVVVALCLCCRDVHSRQKMRDSNGLQILIDLLLDDTIIPHHEDILSALICYYFDENTLRYMIRHLGLMKSLVHHIYQMTDQLKTQSLSDNVCDFNLSRSKDESTPNYFALELVETGSEEYIDTDIPCARMDFQHQTSPAPTESEISGLSVDSFCSSSIPQDASLQDRDSSSSPFIPSEFSPINSVSQSSELQRDTSSEVICSLYEPKTMLTPSSDLELNVSQCTVTPLHLSPTFSTCFKDNDSLASLCSTLSDSTPCVTSRTASKINLDLDSSTPMPANFIDSLLASPTLYSTQQLMSQSTSPMLTNNQGTLESKVLLLLSRLSHLHDCQPILASSEILPAILDYFFTAGPSNAHCFKVLSRVFSNPHCFQDCLMNHAPSLVFNHMQDNPTSAQTLTTEPSVVVSPISPKLPPCPLNFSQDVCHQLFNTLCHVAESPYGQGVIAHMLLRGDSREMTAGCLALTLLQRSNIVCHKMLLGYNGLHNLLLLSEGRDITPANKDDTMNICSTCNTVDEAEIESKKPNNDCYDSFDDTAQNKAIVALLHLAFHYYNYPPRKRRHSYTHVEDAYVPCTAFPLPRSKHQRQENTRSISCVAEIQLPIDTKDNHPSIPVCMYRDSDHCPFDLIIQVNNGDDEIGIFPVHRAMLVESSEVFAVMLEGMYQESLSNVIQLYQVLPSVFNSYLHHVYGCSWECSEMTHEHNSSSWKKPLNKSSNGEGTDSKIKQNPSFMGNTLEEITGPIPCSKDKELTVHYLQLLECADRFYLPSLVKRCEESLNVHLNEDNLVPLFLFSQIHQSHQLAKKCIICLLSVRNVTKQCNIFKELLQSDDGAECLSMIKEIFYV